MAGRFAHRTSCHYKGMAFAIADKGVKTMNNEKEIQTLKNQVNCLVYQLVKINKILARMTTQLDLQEVRQLIAENIRILESLRSRSVP